MKKKYTVQLNYKASIIVDVEVENSPNAEGDALEKARNVAEDADIRELEDFCKKNAERIVPFQPEVMGRIAIKRTLFVKCYEKRVVLIRNIKNKVANSKRLAWYMQRTNDSNSKKKWIKRICYLPILIFGREK